MTTSSTAHWSIGEVLALLQDEFPEVTISKIRFLESQGLIDPERTPSGYRRFYDRDFERLRWILVQQRDHYLPLRVIRDRLEAGEVEDLDANAGDNIEIIDDPISAGESGAGASIPAEGQTGDDGGSGSELGYDGEHGVDESGPDSTVGQPLFDLTDDAAVPVGDLELSQSEIEAVTLISPSSEAAPELQQSVSPGDHPQLQDEVEPEPEQEVTLGDSGGEATPLSLSGDELAAAAGCDQRFLHELERFNLIVGRTVGTAVVFDRDALEVVRLAAKFAEFGLEPRHLRTFRLGAEREVGLVAQIIEPMLRRHSAAARRESLETLDEMMGLADDLHQSMMQQVAAELFPDR